MCDDVITVFNARVDPQTGSAVYAPTVLWGAGWFSRVLCAVAEGGLKAAGQAVVRIPAEVDAGGRRYVEPPEYRAAAEVGGLWTLQPGDVIVRGEAADQDFSPAALRERFGQVCTVLGVTDDRGARRGGHWKVTGSVER